MAVPSSEKARTEPGLQAVWRFLRSALASTSDNLPAIHDVVPLRFAHVAHNLPQLRTKREYFTYDLPDTTPSP